MVVLTIQRKEVCKQILRGSYRADFKKSDIIHLGNRYHTEYSILNTVLNITKGTENNEMYWGWVYNPFVDFFARPDDYYGIFVEVPDNEVILMDYDIYTDYCNEDSDNRKYFIPEGTNCFEKGSCVQCCFKELKLENIRKVVPLRNLAQCKGSAFDILTTMLYEEYYVCNRPWLLQQVAQSV